MYAQGEKRQIGGQSSFVESFSTGEVDLSAVPLGNEVLSGSRYTEKLISIPCEIMVHVSSHGQISLREITFNDCSIKTLK